MTPTTLPCRTTGEWVLTSHTARANPFADVVVDAIFAGPSGQKLTAPAFYDGGDVWRVRFSPGEPGRWTFRTVCRPHDEDLCSAGEFDVTPAATRGFLRATPGDAWGFRYESGEPALIWGDTAYNLFGMAHCGVDVGSFMARRASQGFNLLRVRLPVSPFHPPAAYSDWQSRRTWPWGGSEQSPRFDQFNLDYFATVDAVVRQAEELGIGLEMIMEAWGFEFPFNSRQIFTAEWEELWLSYLIARYDAFTSVYFWTPMNEYEYYPNGDWHYKPVADRWAMRISRWIKGLAQHGHIVSMHNGPREPAFAQRFAADPHAVDAIMFQDWGSRDEQNGWLAAGIEDVMGRALAGWPGSAVLAEYGYERNPSFPLNVPGHAHCGPDHTRRATWRGLCSGAGVIHGFENSWGPWQKLDEDQPGMTYLAHALNFFSSLAPFANLRPAPGIAGAGPWPAGQRPLALASDQNSTVVVYMPVGGTVDLALPVGKGYHAEWFDPRSGALQAASALGGLYGLRVTAPAQRDAAGHPQDWVLILRS